MEPTNDRRVETVDPSEPAVMWQVQWMVPGLGSWCSQDCTASEESAWDAYADLCCDFDRVLLGKTTVDQWQDQ